MFESRRAQGNNKKLQTSLLMKIDKLLTLIDRQQTAADYVEA